MVSKPVLRGLKQPLRLSLRPATPPFLPDTSSPLAGTGRTGDGCQGMGMEGRATGEGAGAGRGCAGLAHQAGAPSGQGLRWWQLPLEGSLPCWRGSHLCSCLTQHLCLKNTPCIIWLINLPFTSTHLLPAHLLHHSIPFASFNPPKV